MPLHLFSFERAAIPTTYVKYSIEPARAEDVPAAIARLLCRDAALRADLRLGADRRLDPADAAGRTRKVSHSGDRAQ
jgi:hypothetical protein